MIIMNVFCNHPDIGRFSEITVPNTDLKLISVEQYYFNNTPFKSSVPIGDYELIEIDSPKYGRTVALYNPKLNVYVSKKDTKNETDRFACLFHKANRFDQLQGCIAPGIDFGWVPLEGKAPIFGVKKSKAAFDILLPYLLSEKKLRIQNSSNLNMNLVN